MAGSVGNLYVYIWQEVVCVYMTGSCDVAEEREGGGGETYSRVFQNAAICQQP